MKWTLTSPDGIGDFVLRLSWLFAMEQAGWKLQLIAREPTLELARLVGLKAEMVSLRYSPYSKKARCYRNPFCREIRAIKKFSPDLIFFGSSYPSFLEEEVMRLLPKFKIGGFALEEGFWPSEGNQDPRELVENYDLRVLVTKSMTEFEKNQKAAQELLEKKIALKPFHIRDDALFGAEEFLKKIGLQHQPYIVVSAGYRQGDHFQGWGEENWARELRLLEEATNSVFVFTGNAAEEKSQQAILERLKNPERHLNLTNKVSSLKELSFLLKDASAYVGKDGGTMHLAAMLQKPILAVFGGGMWGDFFPQGTRSVILTVKTPCRGCHWRCHLSEPVCVRDLSSGSLLQSWKRLQQHDEKEIIILEQPISLESSQIVARAGALNLEQFYNKRRRQLQVERNLVFKPYLLKVFHKIQNLISTYKPS